MASKKTNLEEAATVPEFTLPPRLLTVKQIASWLNVTPITIRRLINADRIPTIRVGNQFRFDAVDVVTALKSNGTGKP